MAFYNSGLRRILGGVSTNRATKPAVDINTAKIGMTLGLSEETALAGNTSVIEHPAGLKITISGSLLLFTDANGFVYQIKRNV